jgi:hypothetical protein
MNDNIKQYKASERDDLLVLASLLSMAQHTPLAANIAAGVTGAGLMPPPWWLRACIWIIERRYKKGKVICAFLLFHSLARRGHAQIAETIVSNTVKHLLNGVDREDENSVGGFSQREINSLVAILSGCRLLPKE